MDLIELIIESNEITARAKAITTPEKWRSLVKTGKTKDFISEGQLTINSNNFTSKALNFPIEIFRGSEIHWDINGKENTLQGNLNKVVYEGKTIKGLFFDFFSSTEDTWGNITGDKLLIERKPVLR